MTFHDHFSAVAGAYMRHRPRYPDALFSWLSGLLRERAAAWDVATGNGQVAIALAEHVERVIATDASSEQIEHAIRHERITYLAEPAEHVSLPGDSVDLITAGAAAHWFDLDAFYKEVRRVARRGAVIALFSYGPRDFAGAIGPVVVDFEEELLRSYWPERLELVHHRYATIPFPFEELEAPPFVLRVEWTLDEAIQFLETWSAAQLYFAQHGVRATSVIAGELERFWGDPNQRRVIECPLFMRVGRVE
ncbi:MAG TPA: class I SAM-dependent methyltransferase [Thermoanaerobaculia bacterium]|jgi:SAM-dependent methyltransferase